MVARLEACPGLGEVEARPESSGGGVWVGVGSADSGFGDRGLNSRSWTGGEVVGQDLQMEGI